MIPKPKNTPFPHSLPTLQFILIQNPHLIFVMSDCVFLFNFFKHNSVIFGIESDLNDFKIFIGLKRFSYFIFKIQLSIPDISYQIKILIYRVVILMQILTFFLNAVKIVWVFVPDQNSQVKSCYLTLNSELIFFFEFSI